MDEVRILIVDDEPDILEFVGYNLINEGFKVEKTNNGKDAIALNNSFKPDLIILDVMMPELDGIETCYQIKKDVSINDPKILFLTARSEDYSEISGLEAGADDYISKPFSPRELMSRVKAVLRRIGRDELKEPITVGELIFDPIGHRVSIANEPINLGPTEYRLLQFFLTHQERVYSRDQILDYVWGGNVYLDERTVDVHIRRLRKAISVAGHENYVQTVRGAGYRFSTQLKNA